MYLYRWRHDLRPAAEYLWHVLVDAAVHEEEEQQREKEVDEKVHPVDVDLNGRNKQCTHYIRI